MVKFKRAQPGHAELGGTKPIFDADDSAMLDFFAPASGSGASILRAYIGYHASNAGDFIKRDIVFT